MALQQTVNLYASKGFAGQMVAFGQRVYTPFNYLSDGTCKAGAFAFAKTAPSDPANTAGVASGTGSVLLGLVERVLSPNVLPANPDTYGAGAEITIAEQGDFYIAATGAATVGQAVLCDGTTGAITFGAVGATNDTGWVVKTAAAAAGDIIIISKHQAGAGYLTKAMVDDLGYLTKTAADELYEPKSE